MGSDGSSAKRPALFAERWALYRAVVMPADAPQMQVEECRRAFIAGGVEVWRFLTDLSTFDPSDEPTAQDMRTMAAFEEEMTALAENEIRRMNKDKSDS